MNNTEAKFILQAYRPGGADADDAQFCAALQQAKNDPELRAWFEREQRRDKVVAARLKSVPVPAGLREAILAGGKASTARRGWRPATGWLAIAAAVALMFAAFSVWRGRSVRTDWGAVVAQLVVDSERLGSHGSPGEAASQLVAFVAHPATRLSSTLPVDLGRLKKDGCRTLKVAGHEILEICFERNGGEFHLYVMRRPAARDLPPGPQFSAHGAMHSVLWTDPNHLYVLASTESEGALKALL